MRSVFLVLTGAIIGFVVLRYVISHPKEAQEYTNKAKTSMVDAAKQALDKAGK